MATAGDLVLAGSAAHFTAAYGAIGLTPDGGMSWLLPRLVGLRKAQDILLTNRRVGAAEAAAIGLVTRVIDDASLEHETRILADGLARGPVAALGGMRALLQERVTSGLATHMDREARSLARAGAGPEGREGVAAFLEKRQPRFEGL